MLKRYQRITGKKKELIVERSWKYDPRTRKKELKEERRPKGSATPDVYDSLTGNIYDYKFVKTPGKGLGKEQIKKNVDNIPNVNQQIEINPEKYLE